MSHMPHLVRTMCPMNCHPTLCGMLVEIEDGQLLGVRGDPDNPDSWGLGAWGLGLTGALETNTKEDMGAHANLILLWGANLASQPNTARYVAAAKRRGAYVVTLDVRETEAAAQSDETLLIRPGTDAALALALMHVIVGEGLYDREFVARHTLGLDGLPGLGANYPPALAPP